MIHHASHAPINSAMHAATIINAYSGAASDILRIFSSRPRSCFGAATPAALPAGNWRANAPFSFEVSHDRRNHPRRSYHHHSFSRVLLSRN